MSGSASVCDLGVSCRPQSTTKFRVILASVLMSNHSCKQYICHLSISAEHTCMFYLLFDTTMTRINFANIVRTFVKLNAFTNFVSLQKDIEKPSTKPIYMIYSERSSPIWHRQLGFAGKGGYAPELMTIVRITVMLPPQRGTVRTSSHHLPPREVSRTNGSAESHRPISISVTRPAPPNLHPSAPPGVPLPSSPDEAPRRSPQYRQMASSSEKNSSSSSSAVFRFVKSTLYLSRPPMPPNPLTN